MFDKLLIAIVDKLIVDTQRLKEELSTESLRKSSHANLEDDCANYVKSILEII